MCPGTIFSFSYVVTQLILTTLKQTIVYCIYFSQVRKQLNNLAKVTVFHTQNHGLIEAHRKNIFLGLAKLDREEKERRQIGPACWACLRILVPLVEKGLQLC